MVEKLREAAQSDWTKQFVGSASTILMTLFLAWISGVTQTKEQMISFGVIQAQQTAKLAQIETKMDERDKEAVAAKLHSVDVDGILNGKISVIQSQHEGMIREIQAVKTTVEGGRSARGTIRQ